ncbi:hypothetical protein NHJ13734_006279 [Beauveria thailandica]
MRNTLNQFHTLPTVDKSKLDDLSISCGPILDVDNWSVTSLRCMLILRIRGLNSGVKDADGLLLRSEVDAAICMSQFQLRDGRFTDHHTKPILIMTILPEQVARLTQTHFDAKQNRLILRQSRLLDLSGKDAGDDAWLLRRWMASTPPVGQTKYPEATDPANGHYEEKLSLVPSVIVSDSC